MIASLRRRSCPVVLAALAAGAAARIGAAPRPAQVATEDVTVKAALDRPAIWVADRLTYTIEIACRNGVDIVIDDLSREKLKLDGLDVAGSDTARRVEGGVIRYELRYVLTTYRVEAPIRTIAPLRIRYYVTRAGQRSEDSAPAGTVEVPGATVAFRSLLPDDQPSYQARDGRPAAERWLAYRVLAPVGLGVILLSIAPVLVFAIGLVRVARRRRPRDPLRSTRQTRQAARAALEEIRAAEPSTAEARRDAFARLEALVRLHLDAACGVPAAGLTPSEIATALESAGSRVPARLVSSVLTACELARYAGPDLMPSSDAWRDTLADAEHVLAAGR